MTPATSTTAGKLAPTPPTTNAAAARSSSHSGSPGAAFEAALGVALGDTAAATDPSTPADDPTHPEDAPLVDAVATAAVPSPLVLVPDQPGPPAVPVAAALPGAMPTAGPEPVTPTGDTQSALPVIGVPGPGSPVTGSPGPGSPVTGSPGPGSPVTGSPGPGSPVIGAPATMPVADTVATGAALQQAVASTSAVGDAAGPGTSVAPASPAAAVMTAVLVPPAQLTGVAPRLLNTPDDQQSAATLDKPGRGDPATANARLMVPTTAPIPSDEWTPAPPVPAHTAGSPALASAVQPSLQWSGPVSRLPDAEPLPDLAPVSPALPLTGAVPAAAGQLTAAATATGPFTLARLDAVPDLLAAAIATRGGHQLVVELSPAALGPVRVRATLRDGSVTVELTGGADVAREALRGVLADLSAALSAAGVDADVTVRESTFAGTGGDPASGAPQRQPQAAGNRLTTVSAGDDEPIDAPTRWHQAHAPGAGTRLDVRV